MFLQALFTSLFKLIVLAAVAFGGIMAGKKLRDSKDAKAEKEA